MSSLPAKREWEEATPITLADGTSLNRPQSHAIRLTLEGKQSEEAIAKACGYASKAGLQTFMRTARAQEALGLGITSHLNGYAAIGLRTMVKLAKSAKSELVRQSAAKDLLDRAGIGVEAGKGGASSGQFQINIGIGGVGGKTGATVPVTPAQPVQNPAEKGETISIDLNDQEFSQE